MAAAVVTEFPVTPDVIEITDGSSFAFKKSFTSFGPRFVGLTTILGVVTLMILLGLALNWTMISARHVELTTLRAEIVEVEKLISALVLEDQNAKTPIEVERLADGYLAMTKAESSTQILVQSEHLAIGNPLWAPPRAGLTSTNLVGVNQLLAGTAASSSANNGR
ncbi:MAG: hypothetical protein QF696_05925 [Acidimicrobiales bacterium]|jgi:hypothetical protein|nr:hypothetical protein [Acidimicrobiales bacterium]